MKSLMVIVGLAFSCLIAGTLRGEEIQLLAVNGSPMGTVHIWNDSANVYVDCSVNELMIGDGWTLAGIKMHAGESLSDFPLTKKGNPKVGKFNYKADNSPGILPFVIPINGEVGEAGMLISVQAELSLNTEAGILDESAWIEGVRFREKGSPATYFNYAIDTANEPDPCSNLLVELDIMGQLFLLEFEVCGDQVTAISDSVMSISEYDPASSYLEFTLFDPVLFFTDVSLFLLEGGGIQAQDSGGPFGGLVITGQWSWF